MKKNRIGLFILSLFTLFLFSGCGPETLLVAGVAGGAGAGTYFYINGELKADYNASLEQVWAACEKTVAGMKGTDVIRTKEIAKGTIETKISDEKVKIAIEYKTKNVTTVSVRVGVLGNKLASQLLHDKIAENMTKDGANKVNE
jgi:hypothetical protein